MSEKVDALVASADATVDAVNKLTAKIDSLASQITDTSEDQAKIEATTQKLNDAVSVANAKLEPAAA